MTRVKAWILRFVGRTSDGWSFISGRQAAEARKVGDGSGSSIVVAAVGWIARNFPEASVRVQRKNLEGELEVASDTGSEAFLELLRRPNDWYSGVLLWMATIVDYWIRGNAYWIKIRDKSTGGRVVALWWIPSWAIRPTWPDGDASVFISEYVYTPDAETKLTIPFDDVVHFRWGFDPQNIRVGLSPLGSVLREIFTDEEAASYTSTILRNLGVPGIVISPGEDVDLETDDADAIKEQFRQQFTADRRGDPMVLGANAKIDRVSFSPAELDLRTLRRIPEERVSGVLGVPAIVAGLGAGLDRSTFANFGEAREAGWEENLIPTQRLLGAELESQLLDDFVPDLSGYVVDFDVSKVRVLQEDENAKWTRYGKSATDGLISLADFRRGIGLPVDEELHDVYLRDARIVALRIDSPEATGMADEEPEPEDVPAGGPVPPEEPAEPVPSADPLTMLDELMAPMPASTNGTTPPVPTGA
jgi:HK97 family phage portal protein